MEYRFDKKQIYDQKGDERGDDRVEREREREERARNANKDRIYVVPAQHAFANGAVHKGGLGTCVSSAGHAQT